MCMLNTKLIDVDGIANEILSVSFPINKIEVFFDNLDHSNFLGFTWERVGAGRVPVGINISDSSFNTIGKTGGEKTHTLTQAELPNISVVRPSDSATNSGTSTANKYTYTNDWSKLGNGSAHNNLPPYIVMAFWKRTA